MNQIRVIAVGEASHPEFRDAARWLDEHAAVTWYRDIGPAAESLSSSGPLATFVVLFQAYPGHFVDRHIMTLKQRSPIAPIIAVLGSWCESETQSGQPIQVAMRVPWHKWPEVLNNEFDRVQRGVTPLSALPSTTIEDERWLYRSKSDLAIETSEEMIAVLAGDRVTASALMGIARGAGCGSFWLRHGDISSVRRLRCCIYDIPRDVRHECERIARLSSSIPVTPVIAIIGFPRHDDLEALSAAGVRSVISKPYEAEWLINQLVRFSRPTPATAPAELAR